MNPSPDHQGARLAVVNPNSSDVVTRRIDARLREAPPPVSWECLTNATAPAALYNRQDLERCRRGMLDTLTPNRYEAVVVAGFVDPAVDLLRERLRVPVVGMGSTALHAASSFGRFGIITVLPELEPLIDSFVRACGQERSCAGITSIDTGVLGAADGAVDLDDLAARFQRLERAGASAICLGSGSLAHLVSVWQPLSPLPLIDGVTQAAALAATLLPGAA